MCEFASLTEHCVLWVYHCCRGFRSGSPGGGQGLKNCSTPRNNAAACGQLYPLFLTQSLVLSNSWPPTTTLTAMYTACMLCSISKPMGKRPAACVDRHHCRLDAPTLCLRLKLQASWQAGIYGDTTCWCFYHQIPITTPIARNSQHFGHQSIPETMAGNQPRA